MYCYLKNQCERHVFLGEGRAGSVKLAMNVNTKQLVAIKSIHNRSTDQEIAFHSILQHPNIIKLIDWKMDLSTRHTSLVMEYAEQGNLHQKFTEDGLEKHEIRSIFRGVCEGVKYLHGRSIIHGDLKAQNILLTKQMVPKICDFGCAMLEGQNKSNCGTLAYLAPQNVLDMDPTFKMDIWSLGILLFEMIHGSVPFKGKTKQELLTSMKTVLSFPQEFDKNQIDLIKKILRANPEHRPSIQEILNDDYFLVEYKKLGSAGVSTIGESNESEESEMCFQQETFTLKRLRSSTDLKNGRKGRQIRLQSHELTEVTKNLL